MVRSLVGLILFNVATRAFDVAVYWVEAAWPADCSSPSC